uniref:Uncharacterized protein n=1 Tax=Trypanosoma congolense (strain IL3000) TaxID=1068625 RepID=G0V0B1_TRYCI|nr:hypothetical protein, unlikely [Trypanosoma congolense IL3000]
MNGLRCTNRKVQPTSRCHEFSPYISRSGAKKSPHNTSTTQRGSESPICTSTGHHGREQRTSCKSFVLRSKNIEKSTRIMRDSAGARGDEARWTQLQTSGIHMKQDRN